MKTQMTKEEIEKNCADRIGPASGWYVTRGTQTTLENEPDPEADENLPRYHFSTLLNWLDMNRVPIDVRRTSDGWLATIRKSGKGFWAQSEADAIGRVIIYVLDSTEHLLESRAA